MGTLRGQPSHDIAHYSERKQLQLLPDRMLRIHRNLDKKKNLRKANIIIEEQLKKDLKLKEISIIRKIRREL